VSPSPHATLSAKGGDEWHAMPRLAWLALASCPLNDSYHVVDRYRPTHPIVLHPTRPTAANNMKPHCCMAPKAQFCRLLGVRKACPAPCATRHLTPGLGSILRIYFVARNPSANCVTKCQERRFAYGSLSANNVYLGMAQAAMPECGRYVNEPSHC
jgi:hypothetical protein